MAVGVAPNHALIGYLAKICRVLSDLFRDFGNLYGRYTCFSEPPIGRLWGSTTWPASSSMLGPDGFQLPLVDIKPMTYIQVFLFVYRPAREVSNYPSSPVPTLQIRGLAHQRPRHRRVLLRAITQSCLFHPAATGLPCDIDSSHLRLVHRSVSRILASHGIGKRRYLILHS